MIMKNNKVFINLEAEYEKLCLGMINEQIS